MEFKFPRPQDRNSQQWTSFYYASFVPESMMTIPNNMQFCYSSFVPQNIIAVPNYKQTNGCDWLDCNMHILYQQTQKTTLGKHLFLNTDWSENVTVSWHRPFKLKSSMTCWLSVGRLVQGVSQFSFQVCSLSLIHKQQLYYYKFQSLALHEFELCWISEQLIKQRHYHIAYTQTTVSILS